MNRDYGICKSPVASGRGTGNRLYDIVPGDPDASILEFRVGNGDDPAARGHGLRLRHPAARPRLAKATGRRE